MGCTDSKASPGVHEKVEACGNPKLAVKLAVNGGSPFAPATSGSSTQSTRWGSKSTSRSGSKSDSSQSTAGEISAASAASVQSCERVLDRFAFAEGDRVKLGEGTSSVCYLGSCIQTGEAVAIKVYKPSRRGSTTLAKFRRQVTVLQEVHRPLDQPADEALWCEELASTDPASLFLKLLDFSKDSNGEPAPDPVDGRMYIVTELAQFTLKDMLRQRNHRNAPLSAESVGNIARDVVLAVAWLHAKGYVHLDIKPENVMMCGGRWKLIDMDGCARAGSEIKLSDNTVSFSPCYCAPEFARGVIKGGSMKVKPSMDAWSVGMTIAELVNLCPLLRAKYQEISDAQPPKEGSISFLKWLGGVQFMPLPKRPVWSEDSLFKVLLSTWLLVPNPERRKTLAQSLTAPFFQQQPKAAAEVRPDCSHP